MLVLFLGAALLAPDRARCAAPQDCEALFAFRDDQKILLQAIECYETALADNPEDLEIPAQLSICYYWKAEGMPGDEHREARRSAYERGMEYAQQTLAENPRHVAANFWYASNLARYGVEVGIMKSLFSIREMKRHLAIVEEEEPLYYRGGPQRYRASLIAALPGMVRKSLGGGSLKDAEAMLLEAIDYEPNFAFSHLILAEVYLAMGEEKAARERLEMIDSIREQDLPEYAADVRRHKTEAARMLRRLYPESIPAAP